MTNQPTTEQALTWLLEQIDKMGELRNATTRDPGFREWRQNALTVLQRIWPKNTARAQRFRRVPFAPPSARASEQEARDCYERGFAEARQLLKIWEAELRLGGPEAGNESTVDSTIVQGTLEGPGGAITRESPRGKPRSSGTKSRGKPTPQLGHLLGLGELSRRTESRERRGTIIHETPAPKARASEPAAPFKARAPLDRRKRKRELREETRPAAAAPRPDGLGNSIAAALERARDDEPPATTLQPPQLQPELEIEPAPAQPQPELKIEPVFGDPSAAHGGTVHLHPIAEVPSIASLPPGRELAELVSELDGMGIPDRDLAMIGIALTELAKRLEQNAITWEALREGMALVMIYPALARRAAPLLLKYLDAAA